MAGQISQLDLVNAGGTSGPATFIELRYAVGETPQGTIEFYLSQNANQAKHLETADINVSQSATLVHSDGTYDYYRIEIPPATADALTDPENLENSAVALVNGTTPESVLAFGTDEGGSVSFSGGLLNKKSILGNKPEDDLPAGVVEGGGIVGIGTEAERYFAFDVSPDGSTVTGKPDGQPICFVEGTLIDTPEGERRVEDLAIGDLILTVEGGAVPVKWIGRQQVHARSGRYAVTEKMLPVCISAGALGDGLPHADLYVSAAHGMIVDGLVIDAGALVNGTTIRFVTVEEFRDAFTYYHIETEAHDVIRANGAPSETFIDYVGRTAFDNYQEYVDLYGGDSLIAEMPRLRISSRRQVPARVAERLGIPSFHEAVEEDYAAMVKRLAVA